MADKIGTNLSDRLHIQEKALQELADTLNKREAEIDAQMDEVLEEIKALKLFLSRTMPDFKKQYPAIRKKVKAA